MAVVVEEGGRAPVVVVRTEERVGETATEACDSRIVAVGRTPEARDSRTTTIAVTTATATATAIRTTASLLRLRRLFAAKYSRLVITWEP